MTEQELRALIRDRVGRQLDAGTLRQVVVTDAAAPTPAWQGHASHDLYITLVNAGDACLVEPAVTCHHCGFCKSHGH